MRLTVTSETSKTISSANHWFALAKNAVWVIGLVAVLAMKINSIDNTNASQDVQIRNTQEEIKILKTDISTIKDKQVDQLVMLTKLVTLAENDNKPSSNQNTKGK